MMSGGMMGNGNGQKGMMSGGMGKNANGQNGMMSGGMMGNGNGYNGMMTGGMMGNGSGYNGMMTGGMMGNGSGYNGMMTGGMMGNGSGYNGMMTGGMMGNANGYNGMMSGGMMNGTGSGTCSGNDSTNRANAEPITIVKAKEDVVDYLSGTGNSDLVVSEVIEFENNFYAGIKEKSTGTFAIELLVNKYTGAVYPEMGPNMMWNEKYGHMKLISQAKAPISKEQALKAAQESLDKDFPGMKTGDADPFYGYYTIEVLNEGRISGMLSVNANSGTVWYHNWHGKFLDILEVENP
jgi:hypothetical protein